MSPLRYELGVYIPEDGILHSHRLENLKYYNHLFCFRHFLLTFLSPIVTASATRSFRTCRLL
jgi:hypothetical protein